MLDFFEIENQPFKLSEVKEYAIVNKEMVMRPVFREVKKMFGSKKYEFVVMEPYGIIIDENSNRAAMTGFKPTDIVEAVVKDGMRIFNGAVDAISDKLNVKTIKDKEYVCKLLSGRTTRVYLKDIPAKLITSEQQLIDVQKNTQEYYMLGSTITPAVQEIRTLEIKFKAERDDMLFFGEGIDPINLIEVYNGLKAAMLSYEAELKVIKTKQKEQKSVEGEIRKLPQMALPRIDIPKVELPRINISVGKGKNAVGLPDIRVRVESPNHSKR